MANDLRDLEFTGADALGTPNQSWAPTLTGGALHHEKGSVRMSQMFTALSQHHQLLRVNAPLNANSTSLTNCTAHAACCDSWHCTGNI